MSELRTEWLSPRTKVSLARLRLVIKALLSLHPKMTGTQATTFVYVAMSQEELTVSTLATLCGVAPTTISKHVKDLGTAKRGGEPGLALIKTIQRAHDDRRQHRVALTDRGVMVARMLTEIMKGQRIDLTEVPEDT